MGWCTYHIHIDSSSLFIHQHLIYSAYRYFTFCSLLCCSRVTDRNAAQEIWQQSLTVLDGAIKHIVNGIQIWTVTHRYGKCWYQFFNIHQQITCHLFNACVFIYADTFTFYSQIFCISARIQMWHEGFDMKAWHHFDDALKCIVNRIQPLHTYAENLNVSTCFYKHTEHLLFNTFVVIYLDIFALLYLYLSTEKSSWNSL